MNHVDNLELWGLQNLQDPLATGLNRGVLFYDPWFTAINSYVEDRFMPARHLFRLLAVAASTTAIQLLYSLPAMDPKCRCSCCDQRQTA